MKTIRLLIGLFIGMYALVLSNPIDNTSVTRFSELVFDEQDRWTLELLFPFGDSSGSPDSVFLIHSNIQTKLDIAFDETKLVYLLTPDSLSIPLTINREGDSLFTKTYSHHYVSMVRVDSLIFGNLEGATVGQPMDGYSIMRNSWEAYDNDLTLDCLTEHPSLGFVNDTLGLSGMLHGHIYDMNGEPVTKLKLYKHFLLHTPICIDTNGTYQTQIFRKFETERMNHLFVREFDFEGYQDTASIQPFELNNIQPDTTIFQDIHLKNNDFVESNVENYPLPNTLDIELINYPNPFNSSTTFYIQVPHYLKKKTVIIHIFNARGEEVRTIDCGESSVVRWNGTNTAGKAMPSGIYYYQLAIDKRMMKTGSMILLK